MLWKIKSQLDSNPVNNIKKCYIISKWFKCLKDKYREIKKNQAHSPHDRVLALALLHCSTWHRYTWVHSLANSILIWSAAWYNRVKQCRSKFVFGWVVISVFNSGDSPTDKTLNQGPSLEATEWIFHLVYIECIFFFQFSILCLKLRRESQKEEEIGIALIILT